MSRRLLFNFNNEADILEINVNDDGQIAIPEGGDTAPVFDSIQAFAEYYAIARNVTPENLKNWELLEHGDVVSYILRAGTAGVTSEEIQEKIDQVFDTLVAAGDYHVLDITRLKSDLEGSEDVLRTLANTQAINVARAVYDMLAATHAFETEPVEAEEQEPEDTRSEMEILFDTTLERVGSLALFATILNVPITSTKSELLAAVEVSTIPYTTESLFSMYTEIVGMIGSETDAILLVTQSVPGEVDENAKACLIQAATFARRESVNIQTVIVGKRHIKRSATYVTLAALRDMAIYVEKDIPVSYVFDEDIDAIVDAELAAAAEEAESEFEYEHDYDYDDDDEF